MLVQAILTISLLVVAASAEYYDYGKHYEPYEYHGDRYSKYDVNRDGVDDRLDLDRNGKIDKYETKYKHGYGVNHKSSGIKHRHKHSKHEYTPPTHKTPPSKYPRKYDYTSHKKDDKDHYATSQSYKTHHSHRPKPSYKSDSYAADSHKPWNKKSSSSSYGKYDYDDRKNDGYGSYSGVSYSKGKKRGPVGYGYDDDKYVKHGSYHGSKKHSNYDSYDHVGKKDYDHYDYKHKDRGYHGDKDYGYHPKKGGYREPGYRGKDYDADGKRYEKYDVTDYDLHPDGKYSKTSTKVYKSTSYHKDDKYDKYDKYGKYDKYDRERDFRYERKRDRHDRHAPWGRDRY